jgi:predicted RNA binding protein YcfA (HicA-like mRNA interferase family)
MPKNLPSLKLKALIKILEKNGCQFYREGKGDRRLYVREIEGQNRVVPIDIGAGRRNVTSLCIANFQAIWVYRSRN